MDTELEFSDTNKLNRPSNTKGRFMAVATKKKPSKKTTKRRVVASRAAKPSKNGKAKAKSAGPGKFDPKQPTLPTMEDVDKRIPELTDECQRCLGFRDKRRSAKVDQEESLDKIGELLKQHDVDQYVVNGEKFFIEPGAPAVKILKVKQNG